jgi:hypothetical protein
MTLASVPSRSHAPLDDTPQRYTRVGENVHMSLGRPNRGPIDEQTNDSLFHDSQTRQVRRDIAMNHRRSIRLITKHYPRILIKKQHFIRNSPVLS